MAAVSAGQHAAADHLLEYGPPQDAFDTAEGSAEARGSWGSVVVTTRPESVLKRREIRNAYFRSAGSRATEYKHIVFTGSGYEHAVPQALMERMHKLLEPSSRPVMGRRRKAGCVSTC